MNLQNVLGFIRELDENNNRDWFQENKPKYETAKAGFTDFIQSVIEQISEFDREVVGVNPQKCVFRIYRDIRFSSDKTPYKTNFGAFISPQGKKTAAAGYYIHIEPGRSFQAGGLYQPPAAQLLKVRTAIADNTKEFLDIIGEKKFRASFGNITDTDKLKTAPRGFPKDHEAIEYLRLKNLIAVRQCDEKLIGTPEFLTETVGTFENLYRFIAFLRKTYEVRN